MLETGSSEFRYGLRPVPPSCFAATQQRSIDCKNVDECCEGEYQRRSGIVCVSLCDCSCSLPKKGGSPKPRSNKWIAVGSMNIITFHRCRSLRVGLHFPPFSVHAHTTQSNTARPDSPEIDLLNVVELFYFSCWVFFLSAGLKSIRFSQ